MIDCALKKNLQTKQAETNGSDNNWPFLFYATQWFLPNQILIEKKTTTNKQTAQTFDEMLFFSTC